MIFNQNQKFIKVQFSKNQKLPSSRKLRTLIFKMSYLSIEYMFGAQSNIVWRSYKILNNNCEYKLKLKIASFEI